ncbi:uncharacterized protein LOC135706439 [Ochlerotatus camptorhynchus]|uniref:uncharacterized protein LOC135706439 n=1 Tax=Ochlerotatus camptorhynchus TaxID=644619 RepID=UPI0031D0AF84
MVLLVVVERYRQARNRQNSVFRRKKRQQEDRDREAMENLYHVNDTRKSYEKLNSSRKGYVLQAYMCKDLDGNLLTNAREIDGDEVVNEFMYLGLLVTAENDTSREIQRRIMAGNRAYFGLRRTLRSNKIHRRMKLTVHKTPIRPVVLYGHETWTMLVVFSNGMNRELHQLLGEPSIVHISKNERLRWAGHVVRMPHDDPVKMVQESDPPGTRRKGAQRAKWIDQVEGDLRTLRRLRGWRSVAMKRVECRRLFRTAEDW